MTIKITREAVNNLRLQGGDGNVMLTRDELETLLEDVRPSSSGTIILPSDFDPITTSPTRDRWDGGKLRAVLHALPAGKRVHIVTDTMTGHTQFNVELLRVTGPVSMHNGPEDRLTVRTHHHIGDAEPGYHDTSFSAWSLGAIMVPAESSVKWDALSFYRSEGTEAMYVAKADERTAACNYGRWYTPLTRRGVSVRYEPQRPDAGPNGYGEVIDGRLTGWSTYGGYTGPLGSYRDLPTTTPTA